MPKVDSRKARLLRFAPAIDDVLVAYARDHDLTINEAAVEAVLRLGQPSKAPEGLPVEKQTWTPPPKENYCPHPRPCQKQLKYGTVCHPDLGGCGRMLHR